MSNIGRRTMYYDRSDLTVFLGRVQYGDLIEFDRGHYNHWAIYIGDGLVTHLANSAEDWACSAATFRSTNSTCDGVAAKGQVVVEQLADVIENSRYRINNYYDFEVEPADAAIIKKNIALETAKNLSYDLIAYNCENFVKKIRNGRSVSHQVDKAVRAVAYTGFAALAGSIIVGLLSGVNRQKNH
eukprot:TRINITY_DN1495_c0_g1_i1.p1 TRINITY_DN1495_c0_g1~~TRINITY_DN1495_c0_g1_i1.p1  ORF type:complete len:185 (-),score=13.34 TRINITY_DN1495_c0_g1_i1:284-838(-)